MSLYPFANGLLLGGSDEHCAEEPIEPIEVER